VPPHASTHKAPQKLHSTLVNAKLASLGTNRSNWEDEYEKLKRAFLEVWLDTASQLDNASFLFKKQSRTKQLRIH
jgi:hypothetical protein